MGPTLVEVGHSVESAVAHVLRVFAVGDGAAEARTAAARREVLRIVRNGRIAQLAAAESGIGTARAPPARHVVDDGVDVDAVAADIVVREQKGH